MKFTKQNKSKIIKDTTVIKRYKLFSNNSDWSLSTKIIKETRKTPAKTQEKLKRLLLSFLKGISTSKKENQIKKT